MKLLGASALAFVALFMLLGLVASDEPRTLAVNVVTFTVVVLAPAVGSAALFLSHFGARRRLAEREREREAQDLQTAIVRAAQALGGKVTVAELVADLGKDIPTLQVALEGLVTLGAADVQVTESGLLVYAFPEIERGAEKASSKGLLDA